MIRFTVYGEAASQGSTRAFTPKGWTRPIITSANKKLKPWRQEVSATALIAVKKARLKMYSRKVPVRVIVDFFFLKPQSARKEELFKVTEPDVDKLSRGILDALQGIVYEHDAQVSQCWGNKYFGSPARAEIWVVELRN